MKILAARIKRQLLLDTSKWGHCAIYENELQRIWPLNEENRKAKIEQFAKEYGFCLSFYKPGLCAIFEKERHGTRSGCRGHGQSSHARRSLHEVLGKSSPTISAKPVGVGARFSAVLSAPRGENFLFFES
jgi:hypothetical protein